MGINLVPWVQAAASLFHSGLFHSPLFPFLLKLVPARVITNLRPFQQVQTLASLKPLPSFTASSVVRVVLTDENRRDHFKVSGSSWSVSVLPVGFTDPA